MAIRRTIKTARNKEIVDITDEVNRALAQLDAGDGLCHVFTKHTTASVTTADLDPGTDLDMLDAFQAMIPDLNYRHPHDPSHVPDHIMSAIIGPGELVPVSSGRLDLGTWQRVIFVELSGPRERTIIISHLPC